MFKYLHISSHTTHKHWTVNGFSKISFQYLSWINSIRANSANSCLFDVEICTVNAHTHNLDVRMIKMIFHRFRREYATEQWNTKVVSINLVNYNIRINIEYFMYFICFTNNNSSELDYRKKKLFIVGFEI